MADRIFGVIATLIVLGYGFIAFTGIKAPFQYDPLGPETWPRILAIAAGLCCLYILIRPEARRFRVLGGTMARILLVVVMLAVYAYLFEPLGFIVSTALFCWALSRLLGTTHVEAALFGVATGVFGYLLCVELLELNLPAGMLVKLLRGML